MPSSVLGIVLHLIPGICRDLAPNLHHHVKHLNLEGLMFQQQVACVELLRHGKHQSGCRMGTWDVTWEQPGAVLGAPQLPTAELVTSNESTLRAAV